MHKGRTTSLCLLEEEKIKMISLFHTVFSSCSLVDLMPSSVTATFGFTVGYNVACFKTVGQC